MSKPSVTAAQQNREARPSRRLSEKSMTSATPTAAGASTRSKPSDRHHIGGSACCALCFRVAVTGSLRDSSAIAVELGGVLTPASVKVTLDPTRTRSEQSKREQCSPHCESPTRGTHRRRRCESVRLHSVRLPRLLRAADRRCVCWPPFPPSPLRSMYRALSETDASIDITCTRAAAANLNATPSVVAVWSAGCFGGGWLREPHNLTQALRCSARAISRAHCRMRGERRLKPGGSTLTRTHARLEAWQQRRRRLSCSEGGGGVGADSGSTPTHCWPRS